MPDLTDRELDVLFHAAHGHNQKQTAAELQLHPETVMKAIRSAERKLGANNLTHAVAIAIRQGLIVLTALEFAHRVYASWGM